MKANIFGGKIQGNLEHQWLTANELQNQIEPENFKVVQDLLSIQTA